MKPRRSAHHEETITLPNLARKDRHHLPALEVFCQNTSRSRRKRLQGVDFSGIVVFRYSRTRQAFLQDQVQDGLQNGSIV